jgi:hypothetical protein
MNLGWVVPIQDLKNLGFRYIRNHHTDFPVLLVDPDFLVGDAGLHSRSPARFCRLLQLLRSLHFLLMRLSASSGALLMLMQLWGFQGRRRVLPATRRCACALASATL